MTAKHKKSNTVFMDARRAKAASTYEDVRKIHYEEMQAPAKTQHTEGRTKQQMEMNATVQKQEQQQEREQKQEQERNQKQEQKEEKVREYLWRDPCSKGGRHKQDHERHVAHVLADQ
jgi:hypothetical protein